MSFDNWSPAGEFGPPQPAPAPEPEPLLQAGVEDERVPWGISDVVLLIFIALIGTILVGIALIFASGLFGMKLATIRTSVRDQSLISIIAQVIADLGLLGFLALQMRVRFGAPFWRTVGWRKLQIGRLPAAVSCAALLMVGALISFLVDAASSLHPPGKALPIESIYQDKLSSLLFLLMAVLLAPVLEETVFRGYIYPVLAQKWGVVAGIVLTGALFGMLHGFQLGGAWWQVSLLVVVGIIFTWVRARTRTVLASYCMHLGYNSFLFVAFLVSTDWLRTMPPTH